jgi:hypothetical protein
LSEFVLQDGPEEIHGSKRGTSSFQAHRENPEAGAVDENHLKRNPRRRSIHDV